MRRIILCFLVFETPGLPVLGDAPALESIGCEARQARDCLADRGVAMLEGDAAALAQLSVGFAAAGRLDRAGQLARGISDPAWHGWAMADLAEAYARVGQDAQAAAVITDLPPGPPRDRARLRLAECYLMGEAPVRAVQHAEAMTDPSGRAQAQALLVGAAARDGDFVRAGALVEALPEGMARGRALSEIAAAQLQAGHVAQAEALVARQRVGRPRDQARAAMVEAHAEMGEFARAEAVIDQISSALQQDRARLRMARSAAGAGLYTHAQRRVGEISDAEMRAWAGAALSRAALEAGNIERAQHLSEAVGAGPAGDQIRAEILRALAQSGEISRAESLLSGLSDAFLRGRARGDIAVAVAVGQGGDLRRALDLALSIEDIPARAGALARLSALF